jgi:hypothetical protein
MGNRNRDLTAFTAVPQPTAPPCDPTSLLYSILFLHVRLLGFLGVFTKLQKVTVSYVMSVCPSVCVYVRANGTTWIPLEIWHLSIFRKYVQKIRVPFKYGRSNTILHGEQFTFMIICRQILLEIRNFLDEIVKNRRTRFMFNNFFPKILPFMIYCGKRR